MRTEEAIASSDDCIAVALHIHSYLSSYIKLADAKAGVLAGFMAALLWVLLEQQPTALHWQACVVALAWGCLISVGSCAWVIWPRTAPKGNKGYIFWENIHYGFADANTYASEFRALCPEQLAEEVSHANRNLAEVATRKYDGLKRAFAVSGVVALLSLGCLVVL
jgi:hypothetical protein